MPLKNQTLLWVKSSMVSIVGILLIFKYFVGIVNLLFNRTNWVQASFYPLCECLYADTFNFVALSRETRELVTRHQDKTMHIREKREHSYVSQNHLLHIVWRWRKVNIFGRTDNLFHSGLIVLSTLPVISWCVTYRLLSQLLTDAPPVSFCNKN